MELVPPREDFLGVSKEPLCEFFILPDFCLRSVRSVADVSGMETSGVAVGRPSALGEFGLVARLANVERMNIRWFTSSYYERLEKTIPHDNFREGLEGETTRYFRGDQHRIIP